MGTLREIVFDCQRAPALARFWASVLHDYAVRAYEATDIASLAALGLTPETDPTVLVDGPGPSLCFQQLGDGARREGRLHLDIAVRDRSAEVARLCALGAAVQRVTQDYTVLADPEGNRFCIVDANPSYAHRAQPRAAIEVRVEPSASLPELGAISSAFRVERVLDVSPASARGGGLSLHERMVDEPWTKDYDALPNNHPANWAQRFDVSRWAVLGAWCSGKRAGAAVVAIGCTELQLLDARADDAVLWDLRVEPELRGHGMGSALLEAAAQWVAAAGHAGLAIETQNINAPACHLYARRGFELVAIQRFAYAARPDEVRLIWHKQLAR